MTTVLLVDDDPILRRTLSLALRSQGWETVAVPDGATAMAAVARVRPDLLLLDLGLPDLDGMEVLRAVRSWTQLPVIVLSARQDQADKVQALDAGADDYLGKPFARRNSSPGSAPPCAAPPHPRPSRRAASSTPRRSTSTSTRGSSGTSTASRSG
jgi:CheY-like chemotaxis protein